MKNLISLLFVLLPFIVLAQNSAHLDATWEFVNEKPGLKVYTRSPVHSSIKELRIKVELTGHIDTLMSIVNDANHFGNWVYKCSDSERVIAPDGYSNAYAATTDFPFPMADRELVAKSKQWIDQDGRYHTHTLCAADEIPNKSGIVRIQNYESRWIIEQLEEGKLIIDYVSSVDPGGKIPTWVVNLAITSGPIKTFERLIELVELRSPKSQISLAR